MLEQIQSPVAEELKTFNELMTETYRNDNRQISVMTDYLLEKRGKQLRPLLVLLSAALTGSIRQKTYAGALLVEMTHTASLVHDDVIDEAFMRRGQLSVNAVWRSKTAVLIGDYILARALSVARTHNAAELLFLLIDSFEKLSEGELIQMDHASKLDITEDIYYDIIRKKTATLLGSCGAIGATSAGASEPNIKNMRRFGECIGMAFQIKDDLLDYQRDSDTGKPACKDLKDQKITLPLLYLLNHSSPEERKKYVSQISNIRDHEEYAEELQRKIAASGAVDYSHRIMEKFRAEALDILLDYPKSPYRDSLEQFCFYILERKR